MFTKSVCLLRALQALYLIQCSQSWVGNITNFPLQMRVRKVKEFVWHYIVSGITRTQASFTSSSPNYVAFHLPMNYSGLFFFIIVFIFRAAPSAYGGSQARGPIGAAVASLHPTYSNMGSELCLRPIPQLIARSLTPERGQGLNQHPHGY